jgi:RNA polymerase sigma factor (sigma-70 family)
LTPETCGEIAVKSSILNVYEDQIEKEDLSNVIGKLMLSLTDKERDFVTRHIYNEETYETIAETSGYSTERVRQIVMGGLKKMKNCEFAKKKFACYLK